MWRLKEILPVDDFLLLNGEFNSAYNNWSFKKNDGGYGHPPRGCLRKPPAKIDTLGDNPLLIKYGSHLKYKCEKILRSRLLFYRVNTNIQFFGQESSFHTDGEEHERSWTLNIFACTDWETPWGGQFVIQDELGDYTYHSYIPNEAVLFKGHLPHMGHAPNVLCKIPRLTVAYTYREAN